MKKTMTAVLVLAIAAIGAVAIGADRSEAVTAQPACPASGPAAFAAPHCPSTATQCPALSAWMAAAAQNRCPALKSRVVQRACPALRTQPMCPGLQKKQETREEQRIDYRKVA